MNDEAEKLNNPMEDHQFWDHIFNLNNRISIFHQWDELQKSGCIDNFRIVSGQKNGFREGWVFADSDAYKWLDAASKIYLHTGDQNLHDRISELTHLIRSTQTADGYIFTYNQFHFPGQRWVNLQIEHELYCLGHLIEACVSHFLVFQDNEVFAIATHCADLLVKDFTCKPAIYTDGHEEIELALIKLYELTGTCSYLDLAEQFILARGRTPFFGIHAFFQKLSSKKRREEIARQRIEHLGKYPNFQFSFIPPDNASKSPAFPTLRRKLEELNGKYFQQHLPVIKQREPVGHAVRFGYLQAAGTRLQKHRQNPEMLEAQYKSWNRMITRKMYVTGGLGSFPWNEGFGKDFELDPAFAYNETCAAIASILWSQQMGELLDQPEFFDLVEWQFYNAMLVGLGMDGKSYLYNNPLEVEIEIQRRAWYSVPCCPPNLSRTISDILEYTYHQSDSGFYLDQYFPVILKNPETLLIKSNFPFQGKVILRNISDLVGSKNFFIRIPSWINSQDQPWIKLNEEMVYLQSNDQRHEDTTASGYDPRFGTYHEIPRSSFENGTLMIEFPMEVKCHYAHPKVKGHQGKVAISRGPVVYCLESIDHPHLDIFTAVLDPKSLEPDVISDFGIDFVVLRGKTINRLDVTLLPYFLWGNRGKSKMTVWIKTKDVKN